MIKLGINVDHIATVRQARKENFPDPVQAALDCVKAGADGITAHLREDRRHIQDHDLFRLKETLSVPLNMEMAVASEIVAVAEKLKPQWACLVPERREELTTEGGLNLSASPAALERAIDRLHQAGIRVSLFVDANPAIMPQAKKIGADAVELHTGHYARLHDDPQSQNKFQAECENILKAAQEAKKSGLLVNAGHGISYDNVGKLKSLFAFNEFNIGFSVVSRAFFVGMTQAVKEMKEKLS